jgi:diguanylate cyclase (GGDEF)-like protein
MVNNTLLLILGGCLLGALQLIAGLAIGLWVRRSSGPAERRGRHDIEQAAAIAVRLQELANEMSTSVDAHRQELEQASQLLTADSRRSDDSVAELVVNVIGDIVHSNQNLKAQLDLAEGRLQEQAVEIAAHISRSLTDPLTGLPNRREFNDRLEERMGAWNRRREVFSLLLVDVDYFKKLNDQHGHLAGDQVLSALGAALRGAIRREDAIARYGGEEFAILLPNTTAEQAALVAQKVREAAARAVVHHNRQSIAVTVSGGIAAIQPSERMEALIQRADAALYAAKAAGRNCAFLHDGVECRLADGTTTAAARGPAARLVELIHSPEATMPPVDEESGDNAIDFGSYLPREAISTELAETCQELRRYLEQRGQAEEAPSPPRSAQAI